MQNSAKEQRYRKRNELKINSESSVSYSAIIYKIRITLVISNLDPPLIKLNQKPGEIRLVFHIVTITLLILLFILIFCVCL